VIRIVTRHRFPNPVTLHTYERLEKGRKPSSQLPEEIERTGKGFRDGKEARVVGGRREAENGEEDEALP